MSESITRNKNLLLPKMNKAISDKNSYTVAIKVYNTLPNTLKSITGNKNSKKAKLIFIIVVKAAFSYAYKNFM